MTWQWLCQRTDVDEVGHDRVVAHQRVEKESRSGAQRDHDDHPSAASASAAVNISPRAVVARNPTTKPTNIGIIASATEPMATRTIADQESDAELADEVEDELLQPHRRLAVLAARPTGE